MTIRLSARGDLTKAALWLAMLPHTALTLWLATQLQIVYYDSVMYFVAALSLVEHAVPYSVVLPVTRAPFFAAVLAPFMGHALADPAGWAFRGPFLLAAAFTVAVLLLARAVFLRRGNHAWAIFAMLLLCANPVFIHYGPFPMHDIPAAAGVAGVALLYDRWRQRPGYGRLAALAALLSILIALRLTLGLLLPILWTTEFWLRRRHGARGWRQLPPWPWAVAVLGVPPAAAFAISSAILAPKYGSLAAGFRHFAEFIGQQAAQPSFTLTDPWYEYLVVYGHILSLPITVLVVVGAIRAVRSRRALDVFMAVSVAAFLGVHSLLLRHNESRYLLPVLVAWPYLAALGLRWCRAATRCSAPRGIARALRRPGVAWGIAALLLLVPGANAVREWRRFSDPVYTTPYVTAVGEAIRRANPEGHTVFVRGNMTPIFPHDPVFHPYDEYFYVYHIGVVHLYFFGTPNVYQLGPEEAPLARDWVITAALKERLLVDLFPRPTDTSCLPPSPPPIRLQRFRYLRCSVVEHDDEQLRARGPDGIRVDVPLTGQASFSCSGAYVPLYLVARAPAAGGQDTPGFRVWSVNGNRLDGADPTPLRTVREFGLACVQTRIFPVPGYSGVGQAGAPVRSQSREERHEN